MQKVYINRQPVSGPWGGGNKFVTKLCNQLEESGCHVVFNLEEDIDVIFCFDPRPNASGVWYKDFIDYRSHHGCKIIQRVGDLGTHGKPELTQLVRNTVQLSDFLIFPSEWAKNMSKLSEQNCKVIHNAPLKEYHQFKKENTPGESIRLITHHWSTNPKKGFEYYQHIDEVASDHNFQFKYIGRTPPGVEFKSSEHVEATGDNTFIARSLSESDIYLTASEEEAGANHVLEALAAGLPVVYHENGGSIENYCSPYGESFSNKKEMVDAINRIIQNYQHYKTKAMRYNDNIEDAIQQYMEIIWNVE